MSASEPRSSSFSSLLPVPGRSFRLALKELRETLRDRRTLMTLVLMPLLVYPLLGVILQKALLTAALRPAEEVSYSIALASEEEAYRFQALLGRGNALLPDQPELPKIDLHVPKTPEEDFSGENFITGGNADLVVLFRERAVENAADLAIPMEVELLYAKGSSRSQTLALAIEQRLHAVNFEHSTRLLRQRDVPLDGMSRVIVTPLDPRGEVIPAFSLATFIPLMLILMTVTGAVYPAIDLTAGERERGTLEVLVAAPVPRMELLSAKFVAVLTVAMLTAIVNLAAMLMTVYASGLEQLVFGEASLSWRVMIQILGLLCLFAAFFSAVLLALTSFARSFKEAQAYLIPLMLVALAPGVFSLTPGLRMNSLLAVTPLVNIVLLGRDLLEGQLVPVFFVGAVVSTVLYALLALALAARVFGSDAILYGSQGSVRDWFRRPETPRDRPTLTQVMFALAVLFPAFVVLGSLPSRFPALPLNSRLGLSAVVTILLFAGWPVLMAWRNHVRFASAFRMAGTAPGFFLVALLWGGALWIWVYELKISTTSPERLEELRRMFEDSGLDFSEVPLPWLLLTLAVVPAVCEEWFFRGYLLSGLRTKLSDVQAVVVSAVLFGLFHDIVRDVLLFDRFFTSGAMGLMLGWLAVRSGSVWPGMLLHAVHNGLLLAITSNEDRLIAWGIGTSAQDHFPWPWLAGSGGLILLGIILILTLRPRNREESPKI